MSLMLVAPSAIATARETSTVPRSSSGELPFPRSAADRPAVRPSWSAALRSRTRANVADQALSVRGDLQGTVPPVKLHGEERSGLWITWCGNP
jgi:hypothetical protein